MGPVPAGVKVAFAGGEYTWQGHVVRTTGQVDPVSRMVSVVVEVPQPLEGEDRPPLLPGAFVEVAIAGRMLKDAVAVPRDAIHGEDTVWLVRDSRLYIQKLDIVRADEEFAYVTSGLPDTAQVVTSTIDAVFEGMEVRTRAGGGESEPNALSVAERLE